MMSPLFLYCDFEQISHVILVFPLLTWSKKMPAGKVFQLLEKEVSTSVKHFTSGASKLANTLHLTLSTYFQFAILS